MKRHRVRNALITLGLLVVASGSVAVAGEKGKSEGVSKAKVTGLAIGDEAPLTDVMMLNVDGKEVSIASVAGEKGTLVIFSCNGCPWVKAWEERIVAMGNEFQKRDIGVVIINSNDPGAAPVDGYKQMQVRAKERDMEFPYVVDATSNVARAFSATRTPEAFLFDGDGKLVYHGTIDDNARNPEKVKSTYLHAALEAVATGEEIEIKETKSLGCRIKFHRNQDRVSKSGT